MLPEPSKKRHLGYPLNQTTAYNSNGIEGENTIASHEAANGVGDDLDEEIGHSVLSFMVSPTLRITAVPRHKVMKEMPVQLL